MAKFDFIPTNKVKSKYTDEQRLVMVCKAFLTKHTDVYDGKNVNTRRVGVCKVIDKADEYTFENEYKAKDKGLEFLFYPTTVEIRKALDEFKNKGYFPFYDDDVHFYGYVEDINQIRGEWTIKHTQWL